MSSSDSESVSMVDNDSLSHRIIMEVQKRPPLYDTFQSQCDRNAKNMLWVEVYQNVVDNWRKLSQDEKQRKGALIQNKWKDIRDSFAKDLATRRRKSNSGIKKKKYVHYNSLEFLIPSLQRKQLRHIVELTALNSSDVVLSEDISQTNGGIINVHKRQADILYDEDISFSKMLVPMLRKLSDDQKHYAKVEILNILHKAKSFSSETSYMQLEWAGSIPEVPLNDVKQEEMA